MALTSPRFADNPRLQAAAMNNPPMRPGEAGDAVALVQQALSDLGYPMPISFAQGPPDGIYGSETEATVRQFQIDQGFPPAGRDGRAGHDTLGRLDSLFPPPPTKRAHFKGRCYRRYLPTSTRRSGPPLPLNTRRR
jgi:peptidoglycan hydrolase-like protein with peptidoglycan-binding domain